MSGSLPGAPTKKNTPNGTNLQACSLLLAIDWSNWGCSFLPNLNRGQGSTLLTTPVNEPSLGLSLPGPSNSQ